MWDLEHKELLVLKPDLVSEKILNLKFLSEGLI